jgi:hypothetical protein
LIIVAQGWVSSRGVSVSPCRAALTKLYAMFGKLAD